MPLHRFRRSEREDDASRASGRATPPCGGRCHVTLPLDAFHRFLREAVRLGRPLRIRVTRGFTRPLELLRLLFGEGRDPSGAFARWLFLLPRDGALHVGMRFLALEKLADRSRVWIFASGFAVSGPRRPGDIASLFPFGGERVRYLKESDLDDCLATLRAEGAGFPDIPPDAGGTDIATAVAMPEMR